GDIVTDVSSSTFEGAEEEEEQEPRRISKAKACLWEAVNTKMPHNTPVLKSVACRNSGALLPLLHMVAACEPVGTVRALTTLSFLLLDKANRRVCHELQALDVLLGILRRATDQQVLLAALDALCNLCKYDVKDKMALWQHPNKGALLSMLSNRHSSVIVVETLRTCRTLCFAFSSSSAVSAGKCASACCTSAAQPSGQQEQLPRTCLEPALVTVASELLHPSTDTHVLLKALKLLTWASAIVTDPKQSHTAVYWHNAVFRIVPLLTHCANLEVVESASDILVNLSEHESFEKIFFASGCIPPLLHLLNHKRCAVSQSASCVLSSLAEGGLSRDKLCQDTALLAMLRVLQNNHCVVVTLGVLYILGRLASYRAQVVRSLKGWGAVQLLLRMLATTRDADAAEGCRQLLGLLNVPPATLAVAAAPAVIAAPSAVAAVPAGVKPRAHESPAAAMSTASSIPMLGSEFDAVGSITGAGGRITGVVTGGSGLCRTISAAATCGLGVRSAHGPPSELSAVADDERYHRRPIHNSSFRNFTVGGLMFGPASSIAAAAPAAAAC
ncbi:hypothetical protein TSOC_011339, partial [Tetrabaena socialis]